MLTAEQIILGEIQVRTERGLPIPRYAVGNDGSCIGAWVEDKGRYVTIAGKLISGDQWASLPYEILVNGDPVPVRWIPYSEA